MPSQLKPFCSTQAPSFGIGFQFKELVDFGDYAKGYQILAAQLQRLKKVATRVRPTASMYHIPAPDFAIAGITVALEDAVKFSQELPRALSATIQLKIEND